MSGFFFGQPQRQLFGYFHDGGYGADRAALLCPPWGIEYENSHRALRLLAQRLSEAGYHVLRFDYSGTGDSWGETTDADLDRWQEDVATAIRELQTRSGCMDVTLIGLRLGAYVAATAAGRRAPVASLVLWDPVSDGGVWAEELASRCAPERGLGDGYEYGNRLISRRFHEQLSRLDRSVWSHVGDVPVLLIATGDRSPGETTDPLLQTGGRAEVVHIDDPTPWLEEVSIWQGMLPTRVLRRIVEWCETT